MTVERDSLIDTEEKENRDISLQQWCGDHAPTATNGLCTGHIMVRSFIEDFKLYIEVTCMDCNENATFRYQY